MAQETLVGPPGRVKEGLRKRAAKPKVRSGCITCKIRRVKCDERRPECQRCIKFGAKCDGFLVLPIPRGSDKPRPVVNRTLMPYGQRLKQVPISKFDTSSSSSGSSTPPGNTYTDSRCPSPQENTPNILREPSNVRFQSQDEHRFFQLFVNRTATHLSGPYRTALWRQIIPQVSEMEDSIRHAVISIGALNMTSIGFDASSRLAKSSQSESHVFALKQYSKAINSLRQKVASTGCDLRTSLVASMLIACFETYHGNYDSAIRQIKMAINLTESPTKDTPKEEVDSEILRAFDRLDIQTMTHTDPFTVAEHLSLQHSNADLLANMPTAFEDPVTSRNYFNIVARQLVHFGCAFWAHYSGSKTPRTPLSSSTLLNSGPIKPSFSYFDASKPFSGIEKMDIDYLAQRDERLALADRVWSAVIPLMNSSTPGSREWLACIHQRCLWLVMTISLKNLGSQNETSYDASYDTFVELIKCSEALLFSPLYFNSETMSLDHEVLQKRAGGVEQRIGEEHTDHGNEMDASAFFLDMQVIMPLDLAVKKCRDPELRRRALKLIEFRPRREGFWNSVISASVCQWVIDLEEEGMVVDESGKGYVTEERRARGVGVKVDDEGRKARVWCTLGTGEQREGLVRW